MITKTPTAAPVKVTRRAETWLINGSMLALVLLLVLANADATFAQTIGGMDKIKAGAKSITDTIKMLAGLAIIPLFSFFGFKLMFSGFSDAFQQKSVKGVGLAMLGAMGIFLFADPLGTWLNDSFNKPA
jgi:hypothetical protein